ncbi:MAG: hypothetical protein EZS28_024717 [Streblomastix strix]|uniref:Uncharacterized protein n=1 Tax=Streblomastix strix TaxID=222440 RepID=A0A5J4VB17_9EUKA|nr:MAG: hypothetical protein EZS28_024717 [Streblomastix strix]
MEGDIAFGTQLDYSQFGDNDYYFGISDYNEEGSELDQEDIDYERVDYDGYEIDVTTVTGVLLLLLSNYGCYNPGGEGVRVNYFGVVFGVLLR